MNPEPLAVCQSSILCFTAALAFSPVVHAGSVAPADVSVPGDVTVLKLTVPKELQGAKGPQKVNGGLTILYDEYQAWEASTAGRAPGAVPAFQPKIKFITVVDDYVVIDAAASGDPEQLRADLERLGLKNGAVYGRMVSGQIPITMLKQMDALESLQFARPAYMKLNTGTVNSEGDAAMHSDDARTLFGVERHRDPRRHPVRQLQLPRRSGGRRGERRSARGSHRAGRAEPVHQRDRRRAGDD